MAEVKVPPLLHKMSLATQREWYKKHGMEMPTAPKEKKPEGKSAAAAKRVKVEPRKTIAIDPGSVRAQNAARQQAYMAKGGRQPIGAMGSGGSNVMAGAGQSTIKDLKASIKAGFNPKVSLDPYQSKRAKKMKNESVDDAARKKRIFDLKLKMIKKVANKPALNKPSKFADKPSTAMNPRDDMKLMPKAPSGRGGQYYDEAAKPDASMAMTDTLKNKMISDKDKRTLGKIAALMASQKNKDKKNAYVRSLGLKAMKAGDVDPARGHSPTRFGREMLAKEEFESVEEGVATAQKVMDRAKVVANTNPDPKKRFAAGGLAQKAMLRTINPTGVNTGITRGGGNKTYRMVTGKVPPYQLTKKTGVSEEVEQIDELKKETLQNYLDKRPAPKIKDVARPETVGKPELRQKDIERANLTRIGRARAKAKIASKTPTPPSKPTEVDYGYGKGRYMGDSVNLEGSVVVEGKMKDIATDREETSRLKAQSIFGGPLKKKPTMPPGKQPASYRYVRGLARKAMKAGKPVTEASEYNKLGQPPEHASYLDVDPIRADPLDLFKKRKRPAQYKPGMKDGVHVKETTEVNEMKKGRLLAKAIMAKQSKHPIAQNMGEAVKDAADVGEYDYEGDMAKSQLRSILANAKRLHDMLGDQDNLPEWVQSKITLAQDYVMTAADYMEGEMNEEVEQIDEITGYEGAKDRKDMIKRAAAMNRMGKETFLDRVKARAVEMKKEKASKDLKKLVAKEEVVTEAEGAVAVTPKEKALAAHHGDPKKITYGDVIKARIKSAAEKAMKKGN